MTSMLRDVVAYGTATRAQTLGRKDIAGKTGTTNEHVDAWFAGYTPSLVGVAWIGFDQPKSLGNNETGAVAALPIWISYMQRVLKNVPEKPIEAPEGVVSLRINADSGPSRRWRLASRSGSSSSASPAARDVARVAAGAGGRPAQDVRNQLFQAQATPSGIRIREPTPHRRSTGEIRGAHASRRRGLGLPQRATIAQARRAPDRRARHRRLVAREAQGGRQLDSARARGAAWRRRDRSGAARLPRAVRRRRARGQPSRPAREEALSG